MPNNRTLSGGGKFNPKKIKGLALWLDGADTSRMYTSDAGAVVIPPGWSPSNISLNIVGWWAADTYPAGLIQLDGSGNVMGVDDFSGMYSDATQTTPAARPQLIPNVLNGKPVFRFNGSTGLAGTFGSMPLDTERTVFAVCKISASLTNQRVFSVSSTNGTADYATGQSIPVLANAGSLTQLSSYGSLASRSPVGDFSQFAVFTNTTTGGSITNYSNGLAGATESVSTNLDGYYFGIGCAANDQATKFIGDIAEIIAVEGVCPPDERAMVEKWLADKYNISGVHRSAAQEIAAVASPLELGGCVGWWDASNSTSLYTTDAGPVVPVNQPTAIAGCVGWWDASDASTLFADNAGPTLATTTVARWANKVAGGSDKDLLQPDSTKRPTITANYIGGAQSLVFDGVNDALTRAFTLDATCHLFCVLKWPSSFAANLRAFDGFTGNTLSVTRLSDTTFNAIGSASNTLAPANFNSLIGQIVEIRKDGTASRVVANGTGQLTGDLGATSPNGLTLGAFGLGTTAFDNVGIAEVIAFSDPLSVADAARVSAYLAAKWSISGVHTPAAATNDPVGFWADKSGSGNHATAAVATARPALTTSVLNGRSVMTFDGTANSMAVTANAAFNTDTLTYFVVFKQAAAANKGVYTKMNAAGVANGFGLVVRSDPQVWLLQKNAGLTQVLTSSTNPVTQARLYSVTSAASAAGYEDGLQRATAASAAGHSLSQTVRIGSRESSEFLNGYIAEIIHFNTALSAVDRARVEKYLQQKWLTPTVPDPAPSIGAWLDKSGNNRHAVQATTANRPAISATNQGGKKALAFDVTTKTLVSPTAVNQYVADATTSPKMFFAFVARPEGGSALISYGSPTNPNSSSRIFYVSDYGSSGSHIVDFGGISGDGVGGARLTGVVGNEADNVGHVYSAFRDGVIMSVRRDGVEIIRKADCTGVYSDTTGTLGINAAQGGSGTASWCEFMAYAASVPAGNITRIERYLAKRWGIELAPQVTHPEAQDWINRVYQNGGVVSPSTAAAVNQFCQSITSAGIRDRFIRLNLFCGSFQGAFVPLYRTPHAIVTNQFRYGTDMTNAVWLGGGNGSITRTATTEAGPQGYGFATKLTTPSSPFAVRQMYQQVPPTGQQVTVSAWMKTNTGTKQIQWLAAGVYSDTVTVTSTWQLFSKTFTLPTSGDSRTGLSTVDELNSAGHIFVYEMQCENGAGVDDYTQPVYGNATDTNVGPFLSTDYSESNGLQAMTAAQAAGATAATKHLNCGMVFHALPYHASAHIAADIKLHPGAAYAAQMVIMQTFADSIDSEIYFSQHRLSLTTSRTLEYNSGGGSPIGRPNLPEGVRHFVLSSRLDINQHSAYLDGGSALSGSTISGTRLVRTTAELAPFAGWNGGAAPAYRHIMSAYSFGTGLAPSEAVAYSNAMAAFKVAMGRT